MSSAASLNDLLIQWRSVSLPSPVLQDILQDEEKTHTLMDMIHRQYNFFLRYRSARLDDHEMSVFDRAFVELAVSPGIQQGNIPLLELFLQEYLMVNSVQSYLEKRQIVFSRLIAEELIEQGTFNVTVKTEGISAHPILTSFDSALEKLVGVYQEAKADVYFGDANKTGYSSKVTDKFKNVCFLRDSAENVYRHMVQNHLEGHPLFPEVKKMVDVSSSHAEHLAGGRKRIFELPVEEDTRPASRRKRAHHGGVYRRARDSYRPDRDSSRARDQPFTYGPAYDSDRALECKKEYDSV
ncbi:Uncharacterized protein PECH_002124 [Penicillium ucsense]|uniref:Uncharacterized protein n=1 Tax=Penicillium ucsense TaxID=2839758 RepID=A0A8J8W0I5_9EURO|nr:Uncharacterized protein PECM_007188 [Penicillium ucsense]KAF7738079.1 Uncharacterized protein PECH_002124 [Penicillium ucsense]